MPKPQGDSERPVRLGRSATRQLRGLGCHVGVDDKSTPGTETARSFSNEATSGARSCLVAQRQGHFRRTVGRGRSATRRVQRRGVGWSGGDKATPSDRAPRVGRFGLEEELALCGDGEITPRAVCPVRVRCRRSCPRRLGFDIGEVLAQPKVQPPAQP